MESIKQAALPHPLSNEIKRQIRESYCNSIVGIGEAEIDYVHEKMKKKLRIGEHATTAWVKELFVNFRILYTIVQFRDQGIIQINEKSYKSIIAAIFYFINPLDIIPDYIPGTGFVDDFYVLQLCLREIGGGDLGCVSRCFQVERVKIETE